VDALGNPLKIMLTAGQVHDLAGADTLVPGMEAQVLLADKAYDADKRVIEPLAAAGKTAVIPPKKNRKSPRTYDKALYVARHLIDIDQAWRLSRIKWWVGSTRNEAFRGDIVVLFSVPSKSTRQIGKR
jgi:transposase